MTKQFYQFQPNDPISEIATSKELNILATTAVDKWRQHAAFVFPVLIQTLKVDLNKLSELLETHHEKFADLITPKTVYEHLNSLAGNQNDLKESDWLEIIDDLALHALPQNLKDMLFDDKSSLIFDEKQWSQCLNHILTGRWVLHENPGLHISYGAVLIGWFMRLETRNKKPNSRELDLYLAVETKLNEFCVAEFNSEVLILLIEKLADLKKKRQYKGSGNTRRENTKKDHEPIIEFILQQDKKGALKDCGGEQPGVLANKIRELIIEENVLRKMNNKGSNKKTTLLHPYSKDQLKEILKRYFSVEKGVNLPMPLKIQITAS